MNATTTAPRYEARPAIGTDWMVVDTVAGVIVSGAESERQANEIAADYSRDFPDGINADEVVKA